jgi:hypothetical protein
MFHDSIFALCSKLSAHATLGSDVGWNFSILVAVGKGKSYWRYSPMPDFMLLPSPKVSADDEEMGFCPILLGEMVSRADEGDRWRMLLQLAICARINSLATEASHSPLVVQAVYLSKEYCAERYLAYADRVGCVSDFRQARSH